jgi:hypothetical protein
MFAATELPPTPQTKSASTLLIERPRQSELAPRPLLCDPFLDAYHAWVSVAWSGSTSLSFWRAAMATAFRAAGLKPPDPRIMTYSVPLCQHLVATGRVITMLQVSVVRIRKRSPFKPSAIASPELALSVSSP